MNSSRDGNSRSSYLPPEKSVCRLRRNRVGHGTTDWFQTGKAVHQGWILSPCLFNLYVECIMRNAGLDEAQARIKIAGRHTYTETKFHLRANKFQNKTYHANSPATQEHPPELQYTGSSKLLQNHWRLTTHYWTIHSTPERRNPAPPTITQASLTRKPWQATHRTPPTVRKLHNKENSTNCKNTERPPQTQQSKQDEKAEK